MVYYEFGNEREQREREGQQERKREMFVYVCKRGQRDIDICHHLANILTKKWN